mgnify:CR=1 FL=1
MPCTPRPIPTLSATSAAVAGRSQIDGLSCRACLLNCEIRSCGETTRRLDCRIRVQRDRDTGAGHDDFAIEHIDAEWPMFRVQCHARRLQKPPIVAIA